MIGTSGPGALNAAAADVQPVHEPLISTFQIGMTASLTLSGTDRYYYALLRELPGLGVDVRGIVLGDLSLVDEPAPGVESFAPLGASRIRRWLGVRRAVSQMLGDANLIVSHGVAHVFPALDKLGSLPLVAHFHGPWALQGRAEGVGLPLTLVRRLQESIVLRRAARYIVLSRAYADTLVREFSVDSDRIRIIPGGVDRRRFHTGLSRDEARRRLGWPLDRPVVVSARRLVPTKGLEHLVASVSAIRQAVPDVLVIIAGSGPLSDALGRQIGDLGLIGSVALAGYADDKRLPLMYRAADLSVVPSVSLEGFGLAAIEALACGTPTLVTPVGGLPQAVSDLDRALVLAGSDAGTLANGITDALTGRLPLPDADRCSAYAERFSWKTIASSVKDVYAEVLDA